MWWRCCLSSMSLHNQSFGHSVCARPRPGCDALAHCSVELQNISFHTTCPAVLRAFWKGPYTGSIRKTVLPTSLRSGHSWIPPRKKECISNMYSFKEKCIFFSQSLKTAVLWLNHSCFSSGRRGVQGHRCYVMCVNSFIHQEPAVSLL